MDIASSIFGLTKNNNGYFKSEKQAEFLLDVLRKNDGYIGCANSGYHSNPVFAEFDEKGITKLTQDRKRGMEVVFERVVSGQLNSLQIKAIKSYKRKLKQLEKNLQQRIESFESGNYNKSGDVSTYTDSMIALYEKSNVRLVEQIESVKKHISDIETN